MSRSERTLRRISVMIMAGAIVAGCNAYSRLETIGNEPQVSAIENSILQPEYVPVSLPMPAPLPAPDNPSSLWRPGARSFFKDTRAADVGDIITVIINVSDSATTTNTTTRGRTNSDTVTAAALLGYEAALPEIFPEAISIAGPQLNTSSALANSGNGTITRSETVNLEIAAIVTQILPNGNLVISGNQEIQVNYELRILRVDGVIRREDITTTNQINYAQIAEARIAYGGRGQISDVQQPRYGSQILDVLMPF